MTVPTALPSVPDPTPARVLAARNAVGLTQGEAAHLVGLGSQQRWAEYEAGVRTPDVTRWSLFLLLTGRHPTHRLVRRGVSLQKVTR